MNRNVLPALSTFLLAPLGAQHAVDAPRSVLTDKPNLVMIVTDEHTIPAVAHGKPTGSTAQILALKSFSGGMQLHCVRDFTNAQELEYTLEAPRAGKYALTARVVTVQPDQKLLLAANDAKQAVEIAVPYTVGRWEQTKPVAVTLVKGRNVLHFTRQAPSRGLTIKEFTLTPVK
jgi:hypothetical protein